MAIHSNLKQFSVWLDWEVDAALIAVLLPLSERRRASGYIREALTIYLNARSMTMPAPGGTIEASAYKKAPAIPAQTSSVKSVKHNLINSFD